MAENPTEPKTLEMRVADLEDKLEKIHAALQAGAAQPIPPCAAAQPIPPCAAAQPIPPCAAAQPIPPCAAGHVVPSYVAPPSYPHYSQYPIPPCAYYALHYIPPCASHYPPAAPNQVMIPPCSGGEKKKGMSGAGAAPDCEDFLELGS